MALNGSRGFLRILCINPSNSPCLISHMNINFSILCYLRLKFYFRPETKNNRLHWTCNGTCCCNQFMLRAWGSPRSDLQDQRLSTRYHFCFDTTLKCFLLYLFRCYYNYCWMQFFLFTLSEQVLTTCWVRVSPVRFSTNTVNIYWVYWLLGSLLRESKTEK